MIAASTLDIISADDLDAAARKAVKISKIVKLAREENLGVSLRNIHSVSSVLSLACSGRSVRLSFRVSYPPPTRTTHSHTG